MKFVKCFTILMFVLLMSVSSACSKNLEGRVALGFNSQLSPTGLNSLSIKFWPNSDLCLQGNLGFMFSDILDEIDIGGKLLFKIKNETNLNVYAGGGLGIAVVDPDIGDSETAFSIKGILGVEYFFNGLPNLAFSSELGLGIYDYADNTDFGLNADTFLTAGIHYYFNKSPKKKSPKKKSTKSLRKKK